MKEVGMENVVVVKPLRPKNEVSLGGVTLVMAEAGSFERDTESDYYSIMEDIHKKERLKQGWDGLVKKELDKDLEKAAELHDVELETSDAMLQGLHDRAFVSLPTEGEVLSIPCRLGKDGFGVDYGAEVEVSVGDHVYFHWNVCQPQKKLGEGVYWSWYEMFFCKRSGESIKMLGSYCLCVPVKEDSSDVVTKSGIWIKAAAENKLMLADLAFVGNPRKQHEWMWSSFLIGGERVIFASNTDIPFKVDGKEFVRMELEDIVAVDYGDELVLCNKYLMIEQTAAPTEKDGFHLPVSMQVKPDEGVVMAVSIGAERHDVRAGDYVYFGSASKMPFTWHGKEFIFVDIEYCGFKKTI